MKLESIIRKFKLKRPENEVEAMVDCGVTLRHIGSGSFRNVYVVNDLDVVAKFPNIDGRSHALHEISVIRRLQRGTKRYADLFQYMPEIYYTNRATGVVLMKKYTLAGKNRKKLFNIDQLGAAFGQAFGISDWDYHEWNFGLNESGGLVLLDFGCLENY